MIETVQAATFWTGTGSLALAVGLFVGRIGQLKLRKLDRQRVTGLPVKPTGLNFKGVDTS